MPSLLFLCDHVRSHNTHVNKTHFCNSLDCFHEFLASITRITHVQPDGNIVDLFTKALAAIKRIALLVGIMRMKNSTTECKVE